MERSVRIAIVEDEIMIRSMLRLLCEREESWTVVGEAGDCVGACSIAEATCPDVMLLDVILGQENGLDCLPQLLRLGARRVVVLTGNEDPLLRARALKAGAATVLLKGEPAEKIVEAIRTQAADAPSADAQAADAQATGVLTADVPFADAATGSGSTPVRDPAKAASQAPLSTKAALSVNKISSVASNETESLPPQQSRTKHLQTKQSQPKQARTKQESLKELSSSQLVLNSRERRIIELLASGHKDEDIARQLSISRAAVRHDLSTIYRKLGVSGRVELVIYAFQNKLASPLRSEARK